MGAQPDVSRARRSARPVPGRRLAGSLFFSARIVPKTAPAGMLTIHSQPRTGTLTEVKASKRSLLVTYKRDGTPVPTPAWAAAGQDGRLYVRTERAAGKVKRLRRNPQMLVAPCTVRGKPLGRPFEASGRILDPSQEPVAERALRARYGFGRALFEWTVDLMRVDMCYLEITPGAWAS